MADKARIAVSGSIATDHLMHFPGRFAEQLVAEQLHRVSLSFLADDLVVRRGGIGANIAFGLGVLGVNPVLVGAVGSDWADYASWLERHGVDTSGVLVSEVAHTARFVCTTDEDLCQIATFYAGAMAESRNIELKPVADHAGALSLVLISPDDPEGMVRHAQECRQRGYEFAVDPSQQLARMDGAQVREFIEGAKYLFSNDYEWELLLQKSGWTEADVLARVGMRITTLGEKGVEIIGRDGLALQIGAVPERGKADPTGVGDGFRAGFLAALDGGLPLERAAQLGSLIAVLVLETVGTQEWTFDRTDALARLGDAFGPAAADEIAPVLPA
ncbi:carbohydrate kinase family protein [Amycolatopsis rhabdoformis]|uniref:Carbohydrate kinase family protein n=1 Tax=Amycolatopsis rhabdoformis TaxID=1448059 RepID=A0ABZ1I9Z8_9PSEU|nr:carbohydrate kinase family protein [Amycolatopsis rhabdoformis]WSE30566.1 carbohydrate kinase family protein [Amycolatopsis rhabdoformis]